MGQTCSCMSSRSGLKPQFDSIPEPAEDQADQPPGLMSASRAHQSDIGDGKAAFAAGFVHERSIKMLKSTYDVDGGGIKLGQGAYGSVTAVRRKIDGEQFALKMVKIGGDSDATFEEIRNEVAIQKRLDHPNIAKIYESYEDVPNKMMYIVMECCTGGMLVSRMKKHRHGYGEKAAATIMEEMLSAVLYCHTHGVVHRDIKLDNMIFQGPEETSELKLIDFGFANVVKPGREGMFEQLGTPSYMAPELWERDDSKASTSAVDMWALGVCAYMLLSGTKPFYHKDLEQRRWLIRHKQLEFPAADWAHVSADAKDFCQRMLRKKAHSRPSASEALALPWITKRSTVHAGPDAAHEMARHSKVVASLEAFAEAQDLKKLALEVIAFNSPPSQLEELRQLFHKMDTDNSGTLSLDEFKKAMALHPDLSEKRVEQIFGQMDLEHKGEVDYTEFLAATISSQQEAKVSQVGAPSITTAFHIIDSDHDGYITHDDLVRSFGGLLNESAMQRILGVVASSPGGGRRITFDQFQTLMLAENRRSGEVAAALQKQALAHQTDMAGKSLRSSD